MQIISNFVVERTIDLDKVLNLKKDFLKVPLIKNFLEKEIIGKAILYREEKEIVADLHLDGTRLKEVENFTPTIVGTLFLKKKEDNKPFFKITKLSLSSNKNSDPSIKSLKDISTLISSPGNLDANKLEGLRTKDSTIPTYSFDSVQEAKALLEFSNIQAVTAAGAKGAINIWKSKKGRVLRANFCQFLEVKRTIKTVGFSPEMEKFVEYILKII